MKTTAMLRFALIGAGLLAINMSHAQDVNDQSVEIWAAVESQWAAEEKGDKRWIDRLLADDFTGWGKNSPAPRNKASTKKWDRFNDTQGKMIEHELYPLSIVVHGDMAVAHYLYTSAYEDSDGEVELSNGRYTDILVRTDDGWQFIAWHGGDDD